MSETLTDDVNRYYDEVRGYLDFPEAEQNKILSKLNRHMLELQLDCKNLDYNAIVDFFGEPQDIAQFLTEQLPMDTVEKNLVENVHHRTYEVRTSLIAIVLSCMAILLAFSIYVIQLKSVIEITYADAFSSSFNSIHELDYTN